MSAYETNNYHNIFKEYGYSEEEIEKSIVHAKGVEGVRSVKSFLVSVKARK